MKKALLAFFCLFYFNSSWAQDIISIISFDGIKKTKPEYLRNFISSAEGDTLDWKLIEQDRQQLANLEVLSDAQYETKKTDQGYEIIFKCKELFTLLPIVNFGGVEDNFWFVAGATQVNLLGKGHKIYTYYQHYDRSSYAFNLSLDRLKGSPWGINLNLVKWGTREPLFFPEGRIEYNYDNYTYGVDGVYRFNVNNKLLIGGAYFTENYKATTAVTDAPAVARKEKILAKALYECYKINHFYFYQSGFSNSFNVQTVGSFDNDPTFFIFFNELKYFNRIGARGNFAARLRFGLSSNQESPFAPFVLDSYLNIRGVGNRVDRGTGVIVTNAEYRHSLLDKEKIAIQGVAFSDLGTWRTPGGSLEDFTKKSSVVWFGGVGARFIHKKIYNAILRIDYGFDLQNLGGNGFVIGVGQYF
ncbi:MAG: hypothetical protein JXR03_01125 [Cyclobacteriaceae bacterium]